MKADNGEVLAVGQRWAYRQGARGTVACVEVTRVGTSRPARVRVRFVADEYEGREEWVPPTRLKARWEHVAEWQAREDRWAAVREISQHIDRTAEDDALWRVLDALPDWRYGHAGMGRTAGILTISDVDGLVADLGIERRAIDDPVAFIDDDGSLVVPWRVTRQVVQALARKHADRVLADVAQEERDILRKSTWGYMDGSRLIRPEICAEVAQESEPARQLVREWCGTEARERRDELQALRAEVGRLGELVERAITALANTGDNQSARELERDLGVPVEVLRQSRRRS